MFPVIYHKDILASKHDFSDCLVMKYDEETGTTIPTNETIEIAHVDHQIKLV